MQSLIGRIVSSVRSGDYQLSLHIWENFIRERDRPNPLAVVAAVAEDEPEVLEVYPADQRGSSCLVLARDSYGRAIHAVVGYGVEPIRFVTAYHPSDKEWLDERIRR